MKKLSIFDLFATRIKPLTGFRLQPRRATGRYMRTEQFAEGTIHYGSRAAYLEPTAAHSKRRERGLPLTRRQAVLDPKNPTKPLMDAKGNFVTADFPIKEPGVRVTPKPVRPGRQRRNYLAQQRANA